MPGIHHPREDCEREDCGLAPWRIYAYRAGYAAAIADVGAILWPPDDPRRDWSPDTLDDIAQAIIAAGFDPPMA